MNDLIDMLRKASLMAEDGGESQRYEEAAGALESQAREIERLRMQLVACGVVALANTPESAAKARDMHPDYMSASCGDVIRTVDIQMQLRAELAALKANRDAPLLVHRVGTSLDQQRTETAADNCEVLRARLARYEDGEGVPITQLSVMDERSAFEAWHNQAYGPQDKYNPIRSLAYDSAGVGLGYDDTTVMAQFHAFKGALALSAPSHGEQVRQMVPSWNLAADELPASGKTVLAFYLNSHGMGRRIRAMHVKRFTVEAEEFADPDTQCCEYSEQDDCYYTTEGWYELIDNWPDYSSCAVIEGVVTHWMPLPSTPSAGSQGGDV